MTTWRRGTIPWVRKQPQLAHSADTRNGSGACCYFCGSQTVKLSMGDYAGDTGRVEVYCDNPQCEAREVTLIVIRDGSGAGRRADVRALEAIDGAGHNLRGSKTLTQVIANLPSPEEVVSARTDAASYELHVK